MDRNTFDQYYRPRLERLCTTNLSDAMDMLGIRGAVIGMRPMFDCPNLLAGMDVLEMGRKYNLQADVEEIAANRSWLPAITPPKI